MRPEAGSRGGGGLLYNLREGGAVLVSSMGREAGGRSSTYMAEALVAIASSTESVRLAEQPPASWQSLGGGEKGRQAAHQGGWAKSGHLNSAWRSVGWLMSARMNSIQQSRPEPQYLRRPGSYMGGYMGAALAVPVLPVL